MRMAYTTGPFPTADAPAQTYVRNNHDKRSASPPTHGGNVSTSNVTVSSQSNDSFLLPLNSHGRARGGEPPEQIYAHDASAAHGERHATHCETAADADTLSD